MKKSLFTFVLLVFTTGLFAQENPAFTVIEPADFKEQVKGEEVQLVDVRTPEEYAEGHIKAAENIDFLAEGFLPQFEKFDKEKPLYIYCRSGNRSGQAAKKLSEMGFEKIVDLKGGYLSWKDFMDEQ